MGIMNGIGKNCFKKNATSGTLEKTENLPIRVARMISLDTSSSWRGISRWLGQTETTTAVNEILKRAGRAALFTTA